MTSDHVIPYLCASHPTWSNPTVQEHTEHFRTPQVPLLNSFRAVLQEMFLSFYIYFSGSFNSALAEPTGPGSTLIPRKSHTQSLCPGPIGDAGACCRIQLQVGLHSLCWAWPGQIAGIRKCLCSQHTCRMGEAAVPRLSFSAPKCWVRSEAGSILSPVPQMCKLSFPLVTPIYFILFGGLSQHKKSSWNLASSGVWFTKLGPEGGIAFEVLFRLLKEMPKDVFFMLSWLLLLMSIPA